MSHDQNPFSQQNTPGMPNPYGDRPGANPYHNVSMPGNFPAHPPAPESNVGKIILYVILGVSGLGLLSCIGCCGMFYMLAQEGFREESAELKQQFEKHPDVVRELGGIETVEYDWGRSFTEKADEDHVYTVRGPLGKGELIVTEPAFTDENDRVLLRTEKGEWEIFNRLSDEPVMMEETN